MQMQRLLLITSVAVLLALMWPAPTFAAEPEAGARAPGAAVGLFELFNQATVEQRTRVNRFLANKYPTLGADIFNIITHRYPEFFGEIGLHLDRLIRTKYPHIPRLIASELQKAPPVRTAIEAMIHQKYPEFVTDLQQLLPNQDLPTEAAQLIQEKYPTLLQDVLATVNAKFPALLISLQHRVIAEHPVLVIDVARLVTEKYPRLTTDVMIMVITRYPELLPGVVAILNDTPPISPAAEGDSEAGVGGAMEEEAPTAPGPEG